MSVELIAHVGDDAVGHILAEVEAAEGEEAARGERSVGKRELDTYA